MTVKDLLLVYCHLIYEGQNEQIFSVLPSERSEMLKKELKKFDRFPKEVRLTLVLKLLGYLVQHFRNPHLEMIHPTWIAESLRKEDTSTIHMILSQFSPDYRKQVLALLGLPEPSSERAVQTGQAVEVVHQIFSSRFAPMGPPWGDPELSVDTAHLLQEADLITLLKHIGVREMARSFAIAGKDILAALLSRFPAELQEEFLKGVKSARSDNPEKVKLATKRLSKYDLSKIPLEEATLRVGIAKIGSVLSRKPETARKIAQRLSFELGMIILQAENVDSSVAEEEEVTATMRHLISQQKILFTSPHPKEEAKIEAAGNS